MFWPISSLNPFWTWKTWKSLPPPPPPPPPPPHTHTHTHTHTTTTHTHTHKVVAKSWFFLRGNTNVPQKLFLHPFIAINWNWPPEEWPRLWPWPWIFKVKSWNCHIYETSDLIAKNMRGWIILMFDILLIISYQHFASILCCSAIEVTLLSLATSVWSCHHRNDDSVCFAYDTCWGVLFFVPLHKHTDHEWNSRNYK